jgi:hypothetical protein
VIVVDTILGNSGSSSVKLMSAGSRRTAARMIVSQPSADVVSAQSAGARGGVFAISDLYDPPS